MRGRPRYSEDAAKQRRLRSNVKAQSRWPEILYEHAFAAQAFATARMSRQQRQQQQRPHLPWFLFRMEMGSLIPSSTSLARLRQMPTTRCLQQKVPQGWTPQQNLMTADP